MSERREEVIEFEKKWDLFDCSYLLDLLEEMGCGVEL